MKYTSPVCDIYKLNNEDVITTSVPVLPGQGDTPVVPQTSGGASSIMGNDGGYSGSASN